MLKAYEHNNKPNTKNKCAILIPTNYEQTTFVCHPNLKELNISSILPPQEIFLMLSEWLAPKEQYVDNRDDKQK
jgi:hypothetical protein